MIRLFSASVRLLIDVLARKILYLAVYVGKTRDWREARAVKERHIINASRGFAWTPTANYRVDVRVDYHEIPRDPM
ncbi:hypothetical protein [Hyphomonas sp.]|uniref:hypothetical protein n=1 Tax=Hyphomonas sp. TaxID=87 RepID=UPI0032969350